MISGIYKITNKINNKVYVGQSTNLNKRWSMHKYSFNTFINGKKKPPSKITQCYEKTWHKQF